MGDWGIVLMEGRFKVGAAGSQFDALVAQLGEQVDDLAVAGLEAMRSDAASWVAESDPATQQLRACIRGSLRMEVEGFQRGALPERLPEVDATMTAMAARAGDLAALLTGYRHLQMSLWQAWFDIVEASVEQEAARRELLKHGSDYFLLYADLVSRLATDGYEREAASAGATGEQRRFQAIKALFEGDPNAAAQLDIDLRQYHLGLVAWGRGADVAVRQLAESLARPVMLSVQLENNWWGWISAPHPLDEDDEQRLRSFNPPAGVKIAFGLEGFGEAGFRSTNHQALRAHWVGSVIDSTAIHYEDVAIEALAGEAEVDARAFFAHELRGINDSSRESQRLRETLAAYFAAELNAASTAAILGVHHQTVLSRLRVIEERLGRSVGACRVELEVALRLRAYFAPDPD